MAYNNVMLFFLFLKSTTLIARGNSDLDSRSSYIKTQENKKLMGFVVKRFDSPTLLSCSRQCLTNLWCSSINFKFSLKKDDKGTCELNKHDISVLNENVYFDDRDGVTFSLLLRGCQMTSCLNGGSCLPDEKRQTFSCACQQPWIGERCHVISLGACGEGEWTLVMKMNGSQGTFHYDSKLWSNNETFNIDGGKTGFDSEETKLPTYWNTSFTKICLGMKIGQRINFILVNKQASSLYSLIADGNGRTTSLGRDTWKKLIGSRASLQSNCDQEGFNVKCDGPGRPKARIGILGNNENDCSTCDSRIGFGTGGKHDDSNTCGNEAKYGNTHIKAMGYILVQ
ncbi:uncharacterized protein [Pocillopora verrucosa]|uniref:uncharacterized protein n=1 Tax=Pocillopora verrucosa TaxID=203993 RepID=UPI003342A725